MPVGSMVALGVEVKQRGPPMRWKRAILESVWPKRTALSQFATGQLASVAGLMQLQETALLVVIVIVGLPLLACDMPRIKP